MNPKYFIALKYPDFPLKLVLLIKNVVVLVLLELKSHSFLKEMKKGAKSNSFSVGSNSFQKQLSRNERY